MIRRSIALAALAAVALGAAFGPAAAEDKTIRFSHAGPAPDFLNKGAEHFAGTLHFRNGKLLECHQAGLPQAGLDECQLDRIRSQVDSKNPMRHDLLAVLASGL